MKRRLSQHVGLAESVGVYSASQLGKYIPGSVWPVVAQMSLSRRHGITRRSIVAAFVNQLLLLAVTAVVTAADHAAVGRRRPAPVAVVAHRARPADLPRAGAGGAELAARRGRTRAPSRSGVPRAEPAGDAAHRRDVGADLRVLRPAPRRDGVAADGPSDAWRHPPVHRRVRAGVGGRLRGDLRAGGARRARAGADGDAVVAAGEGGRHGARRAVTHLDRARRPRARALRSGGHRGEPQTLGAAAGSGRRTWSGAGRPGCRP